MVTPGVSLMIRQVTADTTIDPAGNDLPLRDRK